MHLLCGCSSVTDLESRYTFWRNGGGWWKESSRENKHICKWTEQLPNMCPSAWSCFWKFVIWDWGKFMTFVNRLSKCRSRSRFQLHHSVNTHAQQDRQKTYRSIYYISINQKKNLDMNFKECSQLREESATYKRLDQPQSGCVDVIPEPLLVLCYFCFILSVNFQCIPLNISILCTNSACSVRSHVTTWHGPRNQNEVKSDMERTIWKCNKCCFSFV